VAAAVEIQVALAQPQLMEVAQADQIAVLIQELQILVVVVVDNTLVTLKAMVDQELLF
jgi:hypothetical protein